jgi:hypothetical protein
MERVLEYEKLEAPLPGKWQLERQAMMKDYVVKLAMVLLEHVSTHGFCVVDNFMGLEAGSLLLQEISASGTLPLGWVKTLTIIPHISNLNPFRQCRGTQYMLNLLDSVVTLASRAAKKNGFTNILSQISGKEGRDNALFVNQPVPDASNQSLTATIFLNKAWEVDSDGGELRLAPTAATLATIPPVFDRVVFYPPHLVSPAVLPAGPDSRSCSVVYRA